MPAGSAAAKSEVRGEILLREIAKLEQDLVNYYQMCQLLEDKIGLLKLELDKVRWVSENP